MDRRSPQRCARGFTLTKLKCGGVGLGCNEFVFLKNTEG